MEGLEAWEALDVDESDLSSFLRPCKRHNQSDSPPKATNSSSPQKTLTNSQPQPQPVSLQPHLIPGPAGAVQEAMMQRRALGDRRLPGSPEDPLPTQEFIRRVVEDGHESDHDFNTNPWLSALEFLRRQGMVNGDCVASGSGTPLSSVKKHLNFERVPQVIAVIKSCTPNGFGDMMITLKDPTSTIGASVHHKVFTEGEFGKDITIGSVVVLQNVCYLAVCVTDVEFLSLVVVFSPTPSKYYLNITLRSIVKVFSKDSGPPSEQIYPAHSVFSKDSGPPSEQIYPARCVIRATRSIERHEKSWMLGSTLSLPQERTEGIMTNLRLDSRLREVAHIDKQKGENLVLTSSNNGNDKTQKTVLDSDNLSLRQDNARPVEVTTGGELESEMGNQPNPPIFDGDTLAWTAQGNSSSRNSVLISEGQETGIKNHFEGQKEIVNPKCSIPHWTEEQLDELLAFD